MVPLIGWKENKKGMKSLIFELEREKRKKLIFFPRSQHFLPFSLHLIRKKKS